MFLYFKRREKRGKREAPRLRFLVLRRKTLTVGTALLAAAAIFGAVNAPAAVRASVATRQLPIYCVERDQKVCSISFDAAWGADNTQKILDVLADYGVKATFFVVGNWADQYPEQAKAIVDSGCELMNHSILEMSRNVQSGNTQNLKSMVCHCVDADYAQNKKQEETNMTIDSAKDLQMNIAKEGLALLMLHPSLDVQLHRECIFLIGTAWDIPVGDTQEVISLLDRELDAIRAAGEGGTVAHVLPEDELSMNAIGLETLDNIWDLFETSLRMDSMQARTKMFEMAKWLEESQNLLD